MEHFLTLSSTLHHHVDHVPMLELPTCHSKPMTSGNTNSNNSPPVAAAASAAKGTTTSVSDNADYVPIITGAFTAGNIYFIRRVKNVELRKEDNLLYSHFLIQLFNNIIIINALADEFFF
jgi:hypothetical protein